MNYIDYFNHTLFLPEFFQRRFDFDVEGLEKLQIITLTALPLLSLYRPLGTAISVGMGGVRVVAQVRDLECKANVLFLKQSAQIGLSLISLIGAIANFRIGLLLTSAVDMSKSGVLIYDHYYKKEFAKAAEEFAQLASSGLYIGTLVMGSMEIILVSLLLQAAIQLYQAWKERDHKLSCGVKLIMAGARLFQAKHQWTQIQQRNQYLSIQKVANLFKRIEEGRRAKHLIDQSLPTAQDEVVLYDAEGKPHFYGKHFFGSGKGAVKGMNIEFQHPEGVEGTELSFKINHVFRDRLNALCEELSTFSKDELSLFLHMARSHGSSIKIETVPFYTEGHQDFGKAYKCTMEGVGSILFGDSPEVITLYDRVRVQVEPGKSLYDMHELLSFFDLEDALKASSADDIERMKMGHLFRIYAPKQATLLERQDHFFTLPTGALKSEIIAQAPEMQEIFNRHLSHMELREILPGKMRFAVQGLSDEIHELGGEALIHAITSKRPIEDTVSVLKMGLMSSDMRYAHGDNHSGMSSLADFETGGADSVFTQFLTRKNFEDKMSLYELYYGSVRLLISRKALETGSYQYHSDEFGSRDYQRGEDNVPEMSFFEMILSLLARIRHPLFVRKERAVGAEDKNREQVHQIMIQWLTDLWAEYWRSTSYLSRPSIHDFTKQEQARGFHYGNEVMLKDRVDPSMIQGIIVSDDRTRDNLISRLRETGLIQKDQAGRETIFGNQLDRFIWNTNELNEEILDSLNT